MIFNSMSVKNGSLCKNYEIATDSQFKHHFAGMSTNAQQDYTSLFDVVCWSDDIFCLLSKELFTHEEDGYTFNYRYAIHVRDYSDCFTDSELEEMGYSGYIDLCLVVDAASLSAKAKESICGGDDLTPNAVDIIEYGFGVSMSGESINLEGTEWEKQSALVDKLNTLSHLVFGINSMRGFYLDRRLNGIGTTGWDVIHQCLHDVDMFQAPLERFRAAA